MVELNSTVETTWSLIQLLALAFHLHPILVGLECYRKVKEKLLCNALAVCDADVLLYFPFDEDLHDHSCQRAVSTQTSEASVVLAEDAERGTVAFFNGASSLHVGFIYNYFADRTVTAWTVTAWFKRTGGSDLTSGLVNNGDCVGTPSFGLHLAPGQLGAVSVDTDASPAMVAVDGVQVSA